VHPEARTKPHLHQKFQIFWTNIAFTMACPKFKNGPKNGLGPLGVNEVTNSNKKSQKVTKVTKSHKKQQKVTKSNKSNKKSQNNNKKLQKVTKTNKSNKKSQKVFKSF
jgi:hypothetical protein